MAVFQARTQQLPKINPAKRAQALRWQQEGAVSPGNWDDYELIRPKAMVGQQSDIEMRLRQPAAVAPQGPTGVTSGNWLNNILQRQADAASSARQQQAAPGAPPMWTAPQGYQGVTAPPGMPNVAEMESGRLPPRQLPETTVVSPETAREWSPPPVSQRPPTLPRFFVPGAVPAPQAPNPRSATNEYQQQFMQDLAGPNGAMNKLYDAMNREAPNMNVGRAGMLQLPTDAQAAERQQWGMQMPNTTYSGSGRELAAERGGGAINRQRQARSREDILARVNDPGNRLGRVMSLEAAADPANNFNADGRYFQGAKLGVGPDGKAYFREGERPTQFAGGAANQEAADANASRAYSALQARGVGSWNPTVNAFVGEKAQYLSNNQLKGRLAAGGNSPTTLTQGQLDNNRTSMLARLQGNREKAMSRVQELAQMRTADRRARMNPSPMDRLLQNNPQAALAMQAQQGQFMNQQQLQRLENEGRIGAAREQGLAEAQGWQNRILGGLAMGGNEQALNKLGLGPGEVAQGGVPAPGTPQWTKLAEVAATLPDDDRLSEYLLAQQVPPAAVDDLVAKLRGRKTNIEHGRNLVRRGSQALWGLNQVRGAWDALTNDNPVAQGGAGGGFAGR